MWIKAYLRADSGRNIGADIDGNPTPDEVYFNPDSGLLAIKEVGQRLYFVGLAQRAHYNLSIFNEAEFLEPLNPKKELKEIELNTPKDKKNGTKRKP